MKNLLNSSKPLVALSPMAGITSPAFRQALCDFKSRPDLFFTEFVPVESIVPAGEKTLDALYFDSHEKPIIAQFYGKNPPDFYRAAFIAAYLGFDGIDLNLGCSVRKVFTKGGGAGLIFQEDLVQQIAHEIRKGSTDYFSGIDISRLTLPEKVCTKIENLKNLHPQLSSSEEEFTFSIKTRLGIERPETERWISFLSSLKPDFISLHGRTVRQGFSGKADWEEIRKGAAIAHQSEVKFFGNGDINFLEEAYQKSQDYDLDGVFIGRAAASNPFLFKNISEFETYFPSRKDIISFILKEAELFEKINPDSHFADLRTHFSYACRNFKGAKELRIKLLQIKTPQELRQILL